MITIERRLEVERPTSVVFAYLADFTNTEAWDPGTVTTTRIDSGPIALGTRFQNVSKFRGRQTELEYELTTYEPDEHLIFTGNNKTVTSQDDLSFAPGVNEGSTVITYRARFNFHGIARLAEPFLVRGFDTIADDTVKQLRETIESLGAN